MGIVDNMRAAALAFTGKSADPKGQSADGRAATATGASKADDGDLLAWARTVQAGDAWRAEYAVRTVVDFVATNIASLPWHAYREDASGDRAEAPDTELGRLVADPSAVPSETRARLFHALVCDSMLSARWLCLLVLDSNYGYRLRRIPPWCFTVGYNSIGEPKAVTVSTGEPEGSITYDLPDPRVVLSLGFSGTFGDPVPATSVLAPLLREARALADYRRSVAENSGRVPAWVSRDKDAPKWPDKDRDEFVQGLRNFRRGGGAEGGWPLLEDGMQIHTLDAFKPVDMADLDARDRINVAVANAYHISPENLGFRTGNKSSIQAYKEQLWNVELKPYIVAFEQSLNKALPASVSEPGVWVEANLDAQLRGTTSEQYQALSTAIGAPFMSRNEARRKLNLPAVEGGDELITPMNVVYGNQPSPQDGGRTQNAQTGASPNGEE